MDDMTDARRTTETVTAEQVYDIGHAKGVEAERAKVLDLLTAYQMELGTELEQDAIWTLRHIITSGGHWVERP